MPDTSDYDLGSVQGLVEALEQQTKQFFETGQVMDLALKPFVAGSLFCGRCQGYRRIRVNTTARWDSAGAYRNKALNRLPVSIYSTPLPVEFWYVCTQCDSAWSVLAYNSRDVIQLALFPADTGGGVTTPHTPEGVAFYLDQAARCHNVSAQTAAITMFRSALEWLLEDQNFTQKMLGPKLEAFFRAIDLGTAPKWAAELEPGFLTVIKDLGNTATHTNAGDLTKQDQMDAELYRHVETTFMELLDVIYEKPIRRAQRLRDLKRAAEK